MTILRHLFNDHFNARSSRMVHLHGKRDIKALVGWCLPKCTCIDHYSNDVISVYN